MKTLIDNPSFPFVVGGVVGGVFAILGGYLGSRTLIRDERKRQRHELAGAIQVTRAELARNLGSIAGRLEGAGVPAQASLDLHDEAFRAVAITLARGLPMALFAWVGMVNDQVARLRLISPQAKLSKEEIEALQDLRIRLKRSNSLLRRYLIETMKFDVKGIPTESTGSTEEIEKGIEMLLFPAKVKWRESVIHRFRRE